MFPKSVVLLYAFHDIILFASIQSTLHLYFSGLRAVAVVEQQYFSKQSSFEAFDDAFVGVCNSACICDPLLGEDLTAFFLQHPRSIFAFTTYLLTRYLFWQGKETLSLQFSLHVLTSNLSKHFPAPIVLTEFHFSLLQIIF